MVSQSLLPLLGFLSVISGIIGTIGISNFNSKTEQSESAWLTSVDISLPKKISAQAICDVTFNDPHYSLELGRIIGDSKENDQSLYWNFDLSSDFDLLQQLKQKKIVARNVTDIKWANKLGQGDYDVVTKEVTCQGAGGKTLNLKQIPPFEIYITLESCDLDIAGKRKCFLKVTTNGFEWNTITQEY